MLDAKRVYYRWLVSHITDDGENVPWDNDATILKYNLKFAAKACWSVVKH